MKWYDKIVLCIGWFSIAAAMMTVAFGMDKPWPGGVSLVMWIFVGWQCWRVLRTYRKGRVEIVDEVYHRVQDEQTREGGSLRSEGPERLPPRDMQFGGNERKGHYPDTR